ncbi:MAG: DNA primase, partial [Candidatus Methanofastidiosia archaeon]
MKRKKTVMKEITTKKKVLGGAYMKQEKEDVGTTKYMIYADIEASGVIERPDVVGAIFGQTEGLLGDDLDLRDLQKTGRIGRISVNVNSKNGKASGTITIPSSLDKVETSILAASLETIDRIGPCEARIKLTSIEDVRSLKRTYVVDRAKEIMRELFHENLPETQEIT